MSRSLGQIPEIEIWHIVDLYTEKNTWQRRRLAKVACSPVLAKSNGDFRILTGSAEIYTYARWKYDQGTGQVSTDRRNIRVI